MRILLIEDDRGLGSAVRDQISAEGHTPDWVETLADARACTDTVDYDLILLDLALPDGN
ncbi:MAG: response regulator transcription factor, partial [Alphaproteobacteria bacterium]|nr:response regulator transcription factor [Alphaproteobacteria bacterium]